MADDANVVDFVVAGFANAKTVLEYFVITADDGILASFSDEVEEFASRAGSAYSVHSVVTLFTNTLSVDENFILAAHPDASLNGSIVFVSIVRLTGSTGTFNNVHTILTDAFFKGIRVNFIDFAVWLTDLADRFVDLVVLALATNTLDEVKVGLANALFKFEGIDFVGSADWNTVLD